MGLKHVKPFCHILDSIIQTREVNCTMKMLNVFKRRFQNISWTPLAFITLIYQNWYIKIYVSKWIYQNKYIDFDISFLISHFSYIYFYLSILIYLFWYVNFYISLFIHQFPYVHFDASILMYKFRSINFIYQFYFINFGTTITGKVSFVSNWYFLPSKDE